VAGRSGKAAKQATGTAKNTTPRPYCGASIAGTWRPEWGRFATIADQIKAEHKAVERGIRSSVAHAMRCGELLLQAKASMKHGEWEAWITDNIKLSQRAAQGYMRLAKLDAAKAQRVADLSLREALKQVGQEYGRKQKEIERQVDKELDAAKPEPAPKPGRIIDVKAEPAAPAAAVTVIIPKIERPAPEPPRIITVSVEAPLPAPIQKPTAPVPRAHVADADEVQALVDQIENNLSDADLLRVAVVALTTVRSRLGLIEPAAKSILSSMTRRESDLRGKAAKAAPC